jgi:heme oxygenase
VVGRREVVFKDRQVVEVIVERLRAETRGEHESIERVLDLGRPGWTAGEVGRLLVGMYGFYEPWERVAGGVLAGNGLGGLMEGRRKVPALERDLRFHVGEAVDFLTLPRCDWLPDISGPAGVLGSMYVLEGSTLGGQIIARHFRQHVPGLEGGQGCSFFECYGADVGRMWREFQRALSAHSSPAVDDRIVASARETFVCMQTWLNDAIRRADPR